MSAYLTSEMLLEMRQGRGARDAVTILSDGRSIAVRRRWESGFSVAPVDARFVRGRVELYEGRTLLGCCLVCSGSVDQTEHCFDFKRFSQPGASIPLDFEKPSMAEPMEDDLSTVSG